MTMDDQCVIQYERSLGRGAYGSVFLIRNELNDERYALKRIDFQGNEEECVQARREAEILSKLNHVNVLKYIESFEDENTLNIVTEFCEGGDLEDYLRERKGRQLAEQHIILWIHQVISGLQYIHEKKILHRDLKTKNLFLTECLNIKVGDLGIAKVLEGDAAKAMTFVGTLTYMSPEQFQHQPYNHKADIWSFGCCAYEMVALRRAFNKPALFHNVQDIQNGKLPDFPSGYTSSLKDLVFSMMRTDPKQRPSASKLLKDNLLQDASSWKIQDVVILSEMETKGKPNKSARLRRRKGVAQGKYAKPEIRRSMSWKDVKMEIDKHEQEMLSNVIDKLAQVTLQNNASEFCNDTMRVNESEESDGTMRVNQTYTGTSDYGDTMRVNQTYTGTSDYGDTMRVNRTYTGTSDFGDTMRVNQTYTGTSDFGDTMRVNQTYTGTSDFGDTMRVNQTYTGDYNNTKRVNSTDTGTGDYDETLQENESNDYGDTFVTARSGNDTMKTYLSDDTEEYYDASQSLTSTVATELETLIQTSPESLSSLKISMVSKESLDPQGLGGNTLKGVEDGVLASLEGTIDFSRNPIAAARSIVDGLKRNLTPFDGFDETETEPVQTQSTSPDGGKKKRKKSSFLARKLERKKSETTSPVGSLTFSDSEKATYKNVKEGDDPPAPDIVPKEEVEEEPVIMRPKRARSRRSGYVPFDRRKTTDSIRDILAIMSVPENKDICDDQVTILRGEIINDLGKDTLDKCFDLMSSIQDDNILQVVLQDLIGPRKYEEYRMHFFLLRMFELNSIASY